MLAKRLVLAGSVCLLLTGMRDPFQPPADTCQISQLVDWHFRGVVVSEHTIGLLHHAGGHWLRVTAGESLPTGWRVLSVSEHEMEIATGEGCTPSRWRWKREGTQNAKMDIELRSLVPAAHSGAGIEPYHANSG
ncbi:HofP DNA utilization family protein [Salmonella enterica]